MPENFSDTFSVSAPFTQSLVTKALPSSLPNITESTVNNLDISGSEGRTSLRTAGYVRASNTGDLPENAFFYSKQADQRFRGARSYFYDLNEDGFFTEKYSASGTFPDSFISAPSLHVIPSVLRSNLVNRVKQKVLERVRDSDINIAVTYAERERTLSMLGSSLGRLGRAYSAARSGNFQDAAAFLTGGNSGRSVSGSVASGWLELQYGWLPLMSDIFGYCKTLQKQMTHREYVVVRAKQTIQESRFEATRVLEYIDGTQIDAKFDASCRIKMRSTSMLLKTAAEIGLTNPALVAWELVPFSFVVDWALPIGSFLSQFDSALGWEFHSGSVTQFSHSVATKSRSVHTPPPGYKDYAVNGSRTSMEVSVVRSGITSWAGMYSLPAFKDPRSLTHVLNALALLTSKR